MANALALKVVYNSSLQTIGATEKLYYQKSGAFAYGADGAITVGEYNGGFHVVNASNAELCTSAHPANLAYVASGTVSVNGGAPEAVSGVADASLLNVNVTCSPEAQLTAASAYVYGDTEADAPTGLTCYGFQGGDAAWQDVGGSGAALDLGTSASAASHDLYLGLSVSPSSNGAKTGTLKVSVTIV